MKPFVSVIVPVLNNPAGVRRALDALLVQTYSAKDYEIIVVDNGSIDETPAVARDYSRVYSKTVRVTFETRHRSSYGARNRGVKMARGTLLAFTDSDCIPDSDWIARGVDALEKQGASLGGGRIAFFFKTTRPNIYEFSDAFRKLNQWALVEKAGFAATANLFARRSVFMQYGMFRHDLISGGDYEFGRRVTKAGERLIYIPRAVVRHPARSSLKAVLKKSRRVATGQKILQKEGLLEHGGLSLRRLLPRMSPAAAPPYEMGFSFFEKAQIAALDNFLRWFNFFIRII